MADYNDYQTSCINIARFLKEELKLTASYVVAVKMDFEEAEEMVG